MVLGITMQPLIFWYWMFYVVFCSFWKGQLSTQNLTFHKFYLLKLTWNSITYFSKSFSTNQMVFSDATFYYGVMIVWENDPESQIFRESVLTVWYSALCKPRHSRLRNKKIEFTIELVFWASLKMSHFLWLNYSFPRKDRFQES